MKDQPLIKNVNLKDIWSEDHLGKYGQNPAKKTPFKFHIFPDFLDSETADKIRDDINSTVSLKPKNNDLYKFKQSKDLRSEISAKKLTPLVSSFINLMIGNVRQKLEKLTGLNLSSKYLDITASRYDVGDYLLCHNDDIKDDSKLHGRALAFIFYLNTRQWAQDDGGALIIYESDALGEPVSVNNKISPRPNTLVVFNTSSRSWHSVEEVYCRDDFRLSVNGWFHIDNPCERDTPANEIELCPFTFFKPAPLDGRLEKFFEDSLNPDYLMERTCLLIKRKFKRQSQIRLTNFLKKEKFQQVCEALRDATKCRDNLTQEGPYNKRNYCSIKEKNLPQVCKDLRDAFRSELFFIVLSRLTGLDLQPPSMRRDESSCTSESDDNSEEGPDTEESDDNDIESEEEIEDENVDDEEVESEGCIVSDGTPKDGFGADNDKSESDKAYDELGAGISEDQVDSPSTSKNCEKATGRSNPRKRAKVSDPFARTQFRHLEHGSYSLVHDYSYELGEKSALDVILHFNQDSALNLDDGGSITYLDGSPEEGTRETDCELLTIEPLNNCLSLVYRYGEGNCRFLKYISKSYKGSFQDLYCVYYERPDDLPANGDKKFIVEASAEV